jgi:hypothetical protein
MPRVTAFLLCAIFVAGGVGCAKRELRGKSVRSADGKTYLVIEDNNGGQCGAIQVDGREWPHPIRLAGEIEPGVHKISCGDAGAIEFSVKSGTTFRFDYWGP